MVGVPIPPAGAIVSTPPSDDRGVFRVSGLNPGSYLLVASIAGETGGLSSGQRLAYVPAYYPGTPDVAAAARVNVGAEQDLSGFTIPIARVSVARIEGMATDSAGRRLTGQIRLSRARTSGVAQQPRQTPIGVRGEFVFSDVLPGEYLVHALAASGPAGAEFAAQPVTVADRDPPPVLVRTAPASAMSGQLILEGAPDAVLWDYAFNLAPVSTALSATASAKSSGAFSTGTTFKFSGLAGSARILFSTPDEKWFLKSIVINGDDVADVPFDFGLQGRAYDDVDVVFSPNSASVAGRVSDERGAPVQHYAVVVFSTDRDKWFTGSRWLKMARARDDGGFRVAGLPPGDYWVAAVDRLDGSVDGGEWQDPEVLQEIVTRASRVTLGERQSQTTALRVIRR